MGFTVYYRSAEPVDTVTRAAIEASCVQLCGGRTWLSCEPVFFFVEDDDGHMIGGSKPNFMPHPSDIAAAKSEALPDGTIEDALNILCQLSRDHQVDWEISHDYSEGPIGLIRQGQVALEILAQIEAFGELGDLLAEFGDENDFESSPGERDTDSGGDDDGPRILTFRPRED